MPSSSSVCKGPLCQHLSTQKPAGNEVAPWTLKVPVGKRIQWHAGTPRWIVVDPVTSRKFPAFKLNVTTNMSSWYKQGWQETGVIRNSILSNVCFIKQTCNDVLQASTFRTAKQKARHMFTNVYIPLFRILTSNKNTSIFHIIKQ